MKKIGYHMHGWKAVLAFTIMAIGLASAVQAADYLVIDVSGGPSASSYPVSTLNSEPAGGWTEEYKTTKIVLRRIPAGTFTMGSPAGELGRYDTETQHEVTLSKDFYIGVFQITQKQWERVMGNWPSFFSNPTYRDSRPVERVSYYDIRENPNNSAITPNWPASSQVHAGSFMGKLRAKTGLTSFDLPTEAQWEYACRAGTTTALNNGKNLTGTNSCPNLAEVGRYRDNGLSGWAQNCAPTSATATVGSYLQNQWSLYDMHGNVWEWCLDRFGAYQGTITDPVGADAVLDRVLRGGSWNYFAGSCRSAARGYYDDPTFHGNGIFGFRLAMHDADDTPPPSPPTPPQLTTEFQAYPNTTTNVLSGKLSGHPDFSLQINIGATAQNIEFTFSDLDATPDLYPPPGRFSAMKNRFRISASGASSLVLDGSTKVEYMTLAGKWSDSSRAWAFGDWPAGLYTWSAKNSSDQTVASGQFRLGRLQYRCGGGSKAPVLMTHGIYGSAEKYSYKNDFNTTDGMCGNLAQDRPAYTFDYPNTGDIMESAKLLAVAMDLLAANHNVPSVNVVAHSMGGLVTRWYKQYVPNHKLKNLVSLGSPYMGSMLSGGAIAADIQLAALQLDSIFYWLNIGFDFEDVLGVSGKNLAAVQLLQPQVTIGIWDNLNPNVVNDSTLLTICGTREWVLSTLVDISNMERLMSHKIWNGVLSTYFEARLSAWHGSDGAVLWTSACKCPISEPLNLYVPCNHGGYTTFDERLAMFGDIRSQLNGIPLALESNPVVEAIKLDAAILQASGKAVANGCIVALDAATGMIKSVLSTLSDVAGRCTITTASVLSKQAQGGDVICAWAPGYEATPLTSANMRYMKRANAYAIDLTPQADYALPRNGKVTINDGALITESATVHLTISCENALEMAISELSDTNAPIWETYSTSKAFVFSDTTAGEKWVTVQFRNDEGNGACASDQIILVESGRTGTLQVNDPVGGAIVLLNGKILDQTTPATLTLGPGEYSVALVKDGISFNPVSQVVTVNAGGTTVASFRVGSASVVNDYDGDARSDLAVFDQNKGWWYVSSLDGTIITWAQPWGGKLDNFEPIVGDYDGDGVADLAVYEKNTGKWYVAKVDGTPIIWGQLWGGMSLARPLMGDYDGDGISDLAVYEKSTGYWYIYSPANEALIAWEHPWGGPGMLPVPGDYNGDGVNDLAVYHKATGQWYISTLDGNVIAWGLPWGGDSLVAPLSGDYDGDGVADLAIYYKSTGKWYIYSLATGSVIAWDLPWGGAGYTPVAGDYDGDGCDDLAVYDKNTGLWYIARVDGTPIAWGIPWGGSDFVPSASPK